MKSIACLLAVALFAQAQSFEVASIKPSGPDAGRDNGRMARDPGRVAFNYVTVQNLLAQAYRIANFQISAPPWITADHFDIDAKLPSGASPQQVPKMLQGLLRDRFQMAVHRESRSLTAFVLSVGKGAPKLAPVDGDVRDVRSSIAPGRGHLSGKLTMPYFAGVLANLVNRPVSDMTGLNGIYDVDIDWSGEEAVNDSIVNGATEQLPSLFAVVQEKLGLRLESRKASVEMLIVDRIERTPTEN